MPELKVPGNGYLKLDYWEWKDFFAQVGCPRICSRSTVSGTCGLTPKTEGESAENGTELPHPSVQTTDGRMGHRPATLPRRRFMPSPPAKGPATRHPHCACRNGCPTRLTRDPEGHVSRQRQRHSNIDSNGGQQVAPPPE